MCIWGAGYAANHCVSISGFNIKAKVEIDDGSLFTEDNGYDPEDIIKIQELAEVGQFVDLTCLSGNHIVILIEREK